MFGTVIGGIGLYAAGYMRDMNLNLSILFQFAALILIACAALLFFVKPKEVS